MTRLAKLAAIPFVVVVALLMFQWLILKMAETYIVRCDGGGKA